jgi:hypothetical protein
MRAMAEKENPHFSISVVRNRQKICRAVYLLLFVYNSRCNYFLRECSYTKRYVLFFMKTYCGVQ